MLPKNVCTIQLIMEGTWPWAKLWFIEAILSIHVHKTHVSIKHYMKYTHLDPLQFAYQAKRGTDDAVSCLLHKLLEHLDTAGNYARILFVDFSSAFNTIQRHIMIQKLQNLDVPIVLTRWLFDFLSNRPQCVRVGEQFSPIMVTNTGAPQGCVLSPFLFIL